MTQEDKELLLVDLCARLPYGVICKITFDADNIFTETLEGINVKYYNKIVTYGASCNIECIKPYLRSLSSMTEEEKEELYYYHRKEITDNLLNTPNLIWELKCCISNSFRTNWLNKHHFDYRGLIEKGLALEAPEGMYNKTGTEEIKKCGLK